MNKYVLTKDMLKVLFVVFVIIVGLTGCTHHDLCYHHEHIVKLRLVFDWRDAPDANPVGMMVYFYPEEECRSDGEDGSVNRNRTIRLDISGKEGAEIDIPVGNYRIIAYNNDTEVCYGHYAYQYPFHNIRTRNANITELGNGLSLPSFDVGRPEGTEDEPVVLQPDQIWGCNALDVEISEYGVKYKCFPLEEKDEWIDLDPIVTEHVITLYPHDLVCHYSYEIRNVKGLKVVGDACAAITGMSPTFSMSEMSRTHEPASLPLKARASGEDKIVGNFLTFGHPEPEIPHKFALYVWLSTDHTTQDGIIIQAWVPKFYGKNEENFDVTMQVDTASNQRRVHLIIDGLDLTEGGTILPPTTGGGYQPNLKDWNEEHIDLPIH